MGSISTNIFTRRKQSNNNQKEQLEKKLDNLHEKEICKVGKHKWFVDGKKIFCLNCDVDYDDLKFCE